MLAYDDAPAAIDFLCAAFGFEERYRMQMDDGRVGHAELAFGDSVLNLASVYPEMGFATARDAGGTYSQLQVEVDDVDAHYAVAVAAGATVVAAPEDQPYGGRMYRAVDPEGHRWIFSTPTSLSPEQIKAAYGAS
jgi:PhnB protein